MELAKGEKYIKEWRYSEGFNLAGKTHSCLAVTDKRLINTVYCNNKTVRQEIAIKDIKGISTVKGTPIKWITYFLFGLAFIVWLIGLIMLLNDRISDKMQWLVFFLCLFDGVIFMCVAGWRLQTGWIGVVIRIAGMEGGPFLCGARGFFAGKVNGRGGIILKVEEQWADEIVDCLGAIILNIKQETKA